MGRNAAKPSFLKDPCSRVGLWRASLLSLTLAASTAAIALPATAQDVTAPEVDIPEAPPLETGAPAATAPSVVINLGVLEGLGPVKPLPPQSGEAGLRSAALLPPPPSAPKSRLLGQYATESSPTTAPEPSVAEAPAKAQDQPSTQDQMAVATAEDKAAIAAAEAEQAAAEEQAKREKAAKKAAALAAAAPTNNTPAKKDIASEDVAASAAPLPLTEAPVSEAPASDEPNSQVAQNLASEAEIGTTESAEASTAPESEIEVATESEVAPLLVPPPPPPLTEEQAAPEENAQSEQQPGEIQTAAVAPGENLEANGDSAADAQLPPLETQAAKELLTMNEQVLFSAGSTELSADEAARLEALAMQLAALPDLRIELLAFADTKDITANTARRLSLSRALAVRDFLVEQGVATARVQVRALGKAKNGPPDRVDIKPQGS